MFIADGQSRASHESFGLVGCAGDVFAAGPRGNQLDLAEKKSRKKLTVQRPTACSTLVQSETVLAESARQIRRMRLRMKLSVTLRAEAIPAGTGRTPNGLRFICAPPFTSCFIHCKRVLLYS